MQPVNRHATRDVSPLRCFPDHFRDSLPRLPPRRQRPGPVGGVGRPRAHLPRPPRPLPRRTGRVPAEPRRRHSAEEVAVPCEPWRAHLPLHPVAGCHLTQSVHALSKPTLVDDTHQRQHAQQRPTLFAHHVAPTCTVTAPPLSLPAPPEPQRVVSGGRLPPPPDPVGHDRPRSRGLPPPPVGRPGFADGDEPGAVAAQAPLTAHGRDGGRG